VPKPDDLQLDHVANLARIDLTAEEKARFATQLASVLEYIAQLNEVDVTGVAPLTGAANMAMAMRADEVTDGGYPDKVLSNAPERIGDFYVVPKVVE
jgi:aspartyl-tRNA(Asn)/glutamyl-tRNA(Gln) amidotransferase subunit C